MNAWNIEFIRDNKTKNNSSEFDIELWKCKSCGLVRIDNKKPNECIKCKQNKFEKYIPTDKIECEKFEFNK